MVSAMRASLKASPHGPPSGGWPGVRRWSSQTMAGRSGRPWRSTLIAVARWVVKATPAMAALSTPGLAHSPWHAWQSALQ